MKLTKNAVATMVLPAGKAEHFEWDEALPGFGVRLRGDSKRWVLQYRVGPQQRRESLGDVRKVDLDDARKIARQRFAKVELGIDPAAERARGRALATASRITLAVVVGRYLEAKQSALRQSTFKAAERYFGVHWKPLHDRALDAIKRPDVAARLQELVKAHGRTSAGRARDHLSALYGWALREGLCEVNPVLATNDPTAGIQPRDRVLSDAEIAVIWRAAGDDDFGRIVKLLLLTGCRREEIGAIAWDELDFNTGLMTIPGTRTKNGRTLELPLPALAIEILQSAPRRSDRPYVFGNSGGGYSAWSYSTLRLNNRIIEAEGKPLALWRLHDLRRTMRSGLGRLGTPPHVAELAINHVKGGIEAIYDRHRYQREIGTALALWARSRRVSHHGQRSQGRRNKTAGLNPMRAPSAPFGAALDEYIVARTPAGAKKPRIPVSVDRELVDRWIDYYETNPRRLETEWLEIQTAAAPDRPILPAELIETVVAAWRTTRSTINRMFGYAGIADGRRTILTPDSGLKQEWSILHYALRKKLSKLPADLFAAHAMVQDAEFTIRVLLDELSGLPEFELSQKDENGSRALRLFMQIVHKYLHLHCGRHLDAQVAMLAEIAFDRDVTVDQAVSARRATMKRDHSN